MISARCSRFSGGLRGGSVSNTGCCWLSTFNLLHTEDAVTMAGMPTCCLVTAEPGQNVLFEQVSPSNRAVLSEAQCQELLIFRPIYYNSVLEGVGGVAVMLRACICNGLNSVHCCWDTDRRVQIATVSCMHILFYARIYLSNDANQSERRDREQYLPWCNWCLHQSPLDSTSPQ